MIAARIPLSERGLMAVYTYRIEVPGSVAQVAFHGPRAPHHGARRRDFALRYALAVSRGEKDPCGAARALRGQVETVD